MEVIMAMSDSTTLVASSRPPSPTSSRSTSGAARQNSHRPARVANSKKVRAIVAPGRLHRGKGGAVRVVGQLLTVDAHPFGEAQQVWRGVDPHLVTGGHQYAGGHGAGGALAVGARHRDHLERQLGEAHAPGDGADPLQPHVDVDRVDLLQIRKPVDQRPALGLLHV